jgi:hypothetical protein
MTSSYSIIRPTYGTLQAAIANKVSFPGEHGYDHARQARNPLAGQPSVAVVSAAGGSGAEAPGRPLRPRP